MRKAARMQCKGLQQPMWRMSPWGSCHRRRLAMCRRRQAGSARRAARGGSRSSWRRSVRAWLPRWLLILAAILRMREMPLLTESVLDVSTSSSSAVPSEVDVPSPPGEPAEGTSAIGLAVGPTYCMLASRMQDHYHNRPHTPHTHAHRTPSHHTKPQGYTSPHTIPKRMPPIGMVVCSLSVGPL